MNKTSLALKMQSQLTKRKVIPAKLLKPCPPEKRKLVGVPLYIEAYKGNLFYRMPEETEASLSNVLNACANYLYLKDEKRKELTEDEKDLLDGAVAVLDSIRKELKDELRYLEN